MVNMVPWIITCKVIGMVCMAILALVCCSCLAMTAYSLNGASTTCDGFTRKIQIRDETAALNFVASISGVVIAVTGAMIFLIWDRGLWGPALVAKIFLLILVVWQCTVFIIAWSLLANDISDEERESNCKVSGGWAALLALDLLADILWALMIILVIVSWLLGIREEPVLPN
eukprot:TRINITY_DN258_c1_g1_i1.p1 TRINITY_DN258_c1_g1~~TRINITY_DN258_c1_g1_i1.p1  ORF type:complete len:172 (-),score=15.41 TRINITY_DN258_c1_g1_i1:169-684(-)